MEEVSEEAAWGGGRRHRLLGEAGRQRWRLGRTTVESLVGEARDLGTTTAVAEVGEARGEDGGAEVGRPA